MTWKKYWQIHSGKTKSQPGKGGGGGRDLPGNVARKYAFPPEIYEGNPQRLERYKVYDMMDQDSEVRASLDIISDFATTVDDKSKMSFDIEYEEATEAEIEIIKNCFKQWMKLNNFNRSIWEIFRHTIKYGDQFFIRDPETLEWRWVDPSKVESILVDENKGKEPVFYLIRDLDLNLQASTATNAETFNTLMSTNINFISNRSWSKAGPPQGQGGGGAWGKNNGTEKENKLWAVQASHVIHISLSQGMDANWPFGNSILEGIYKTYKQKELLEESVLIYRVTRAPERRIFHIDVGDMPTFKATSYLEKVKNEIHQRRMPNRTGGGVSIVDSGYSPLAMMDDYFFARTADGRGSDVATLPGGENLGEINDLKYFLNKLIRGLQIPSSYLPTGPDDGTTAYSDGKAGTAYIQEFRFSRYCERLQNLICHYFDHEFKYFLKEKGLMIDTSIFEVKFNTPQNFSQFAQIERDMAQIDVFSKVAEIKYISKRFALKRWMRLTEDEIKENEEMWIEENSKKVKASTEQEPSMAGGGGGLSDVGIKGSEVNSFDDEFGDMPENDEESDGGEGGDSGAAMGAPDIGGAPDAGMGDMGGGMPT